MIEAVLMKLGEELAKAAIPLIVEAVKGGATQEQIDKAVIAAMVAASDAAILAELGPDAPPSTVKGS